MIKKKFKLFISVGILAGIIIAGFLLLHKPNQKNTVVIPRDPLFGWKFPDIKIPLTTAVPTKIGSGKNLFDFEIAYSSIRDPGGIPEGLPVRLKVPIIGVNSAIEDAYITPEGRMDVPAGSVNVAWFALGPHPGQVGSAVVGGHFGISNGVKFVFYDLDKLKIGDKIYIENDKGDTLAFQVRTIKLFDRNADATTVFTSTDGLAHLNVITCEGIWNQVNGAYPSRRVIFTDAIPSEGAITVNPMLPVTALPTQNPAPAPNPTINPTPISPAPAPTPISNPTTTPSSGENSSATAQTTPRSLKSLFATPGDGLITSVLIISIVFLLFKIIL